MINYVQLHTYVYNSWVYFWEWGYVLSVKILLCTLIKSQSVTELLIRLAASFAAECRAAVSSRAVRISCSAINHFLSAVSALVIVSLPAFPRRLQSSRQQNRASEQSLTLIVVMSLKCDQQYCVDAAVRKFPRSGLRCAIVLISISVLTGNLAALFLPFRQAVQDRADSTTLL